VVILTLWRRPDRRAPDTLRCRCDDSISKTRTSRSPIRLSRHRPRSTPFRSPPCPANRRAGGVVKFQALKNAVRVRCREGFIQGPGGEGREIVQHHTDLHRIRIMDVSAVTHSGGRILRGSLLRHLYVAPRFMRAEKHEHVGGTVTAVCTVVALLLAGFGRDGLTHLADELCRTFVVANHRTLWIGCFEVKIEQLLDPCDVGASLRRGCRSRPSRGESNGGTTSMSAMARPICS
jgi:hypothetical protein